MLAVLAVIELSDVIFAVDSIPAIFGVTRETFIVFSATALALIGLRSMYFLLAGMRDRFVYLDIGLAVLLVFIGAKFMLTEVVQIGVGVSLLVIVGIMTAAIAVVSVEIAVVCSGIVSSPGVGGERRPRQRTAAGAALRWARTPNRDARALSPHHKPPEALWRDPQRAGELRLRAP